MNEKQPPTIQLDQFLKTCGVATGGQAKLLIQSGEVLVNQQVETRRRKKLSPGDEVELAGEVFVVSEVETEDATTDLDNPPLKAEFDCIDIGANLTNKAFRDDLWEVVENARAVGVFQMVLTGTCLRTSRESARLAQQNPGLFGATAGIHPHDAASFDADTRKTLAELYSLPEVLAVGECGLDFNRDFSPRDAQRHCFEQHLELAEQTGLPLFLHERDAHEEFLETMKSWRDRISQGVVHCFTGTKEQMTAYLDLDLHIGITGWICDERRGVHLHEAVKHIPANRLMVETDCPYLAPRDMKPRVHRNEPKFLPHIVKFIAKCRGEDPQELASATVQTTHEFFDVATPQSDSA